MLPVVVVEVDVRADSSVQRFVTVEGTPVIHVGLHRLIPRLHAGLVIHPPRLINALDDVQTFEPVSQPI